MSRKVDRRCTGKLVQKTLHFKITIAHTRTESGARLVTPDANAVRCSARGLARVCVTTTLLSQEVRSRPRDRCCARSATGVLQHLFRFPLIFAQSPI